MSSECNFKVNAVGLKQVNVYKYLDTLVKADGKWTEDDKWWIDQAKAAFNNMKNIICNISVNCEKNRF